MNNALIDALQTVPKTEEYVFENGDTKKPFIDRKKLLIGLCRIARVRRFTSQSFRHFRASQLGMKGVSLPGIQMILGHDNVITTSKYIQSLALHPACCCGLS